MRKKLLLYHKNTNLSFIIVNLRCFPTILFSRPKTPWSHKLTDRNNKERQATILEKNYDLLNILNKQSKRVLGSHFMVTGQNLSVIFIWIADFSYRNSPTMSRQQLQPIVSTLPDPIPPRLHYSWLRRISVTYARLRDSSGCESQVRVT